MKYFLALTLIIGFGSITILGAYAMGHVAQMHLGCLVASSQNADCPAEGLFSALFHISAFKAFSTAVFPLGQMLAFLILAVFSASFALSKLFPPEQGLSHRSLSDAELSSPRNKISKYLTLFEKRDPASSLI